MRESSSLCGARRSFLDFDLAAIYGVPTKARNQAVKRNAGRFPQDFCFTLTADECKPCGASLAPHPNLCGHNL
ncbi:MAG: ORF6N domain-containing protein [Verrucomicrobia bacterium]|nr:ORF6N domain-containing protein [Verrucomicrobiota bacterium]